MGSLELIVYAYPDETTANEALKRLKDAKKEGVLEIVNAAVIVKDESGKLHFKETADPGAKEGAVFGAIVGGLIGLVGGPAGVILGAATGAGAGGFAAGKVDMGISEADLKDLGSALNPGTSVIVAVIEDQWSSVLHTELQTGAEIVLQAALKEEIASQLTKDNQ
jgi:uncharacterized membrane protein